MSATIALLGQPNSGKSTLFNALTGLRQHVGNWPGKTVEKKEGTFTHKGDTYSVADLPGSYSMSANSDEEVITRDFIASGNSILEKVGLAIEPVTKFFGMPWQLFLAFIASSVGKEGAVGVITALYSGGSIGTAFSEAMAGGARAANLNELLLANVTRPEALAFIFAITFNLPCVVALAATYQEIHSVKWTAKIALYYTVSALLLGCIAYHIGMLIW